MMDKFTEIDPKILANRIDVLCKNRDTTINKMLERCSLKKSVVDNLKKGSMPSIDKLFAIANYFDVTIDELIGNEQKNKPYAEAKGYSEYAINLLSQIDKLSPANRSKLSELVGLYLSAQDNKQ